MASKRKRKRDFLCPTEKHVCAICREEKENKDLAILNHCDHRYCPTCIAQWFEKENSCPQCRKKTTLIDIPGRKRRKRVKEKSLTDEPEEERGTNIISMAVMNYVASSQFRQYMARTVLRRNNDRATMLWEIIQRTLPVLNRQIQTDMIQNPENLGMATYDVLDATDAMMRLRYATRRSESNL